MEEFLEPLRPLVIDLAPDLSYCDKYLATAHRDDGKYVQVDFPLLSWLNISAKRFQT